MGRREERGKEGGEGEGGRRGRKEGGEGEGGGKQRRRNGRRDLYMYDGEINRIKYGSKNKYACTHTHTYKQVHVIYCTNT